MAMPKISVITVTYQAEKTIERAILSVLEQKYDNLEYIIIDGGSTDGTVDIIRRYDDRIHFWVSEADGGISDAFNRGIAQASGEIIGIINADDGLLPGALAAVAAAYDPTVDMYRGQIELWKEDTGTRVTEIPSVPLTYSAKDKVSHQGTFVRRDAYERFGVYDTAFRYAMDIDLILRHQNAGAKLLYVPEPLAFYTLNGLSSRPFTKETWAELKMILYKNGATDKQVRKFVRVKRCKQILTRILGKDRVIRWSNARRRRAEGRT